MVKLICVTNRHLVHGDLCMQLEKIFKSCNKPDILILREKDMKEDDYKTLAKKVAKLCSESGVECILHSFKNIADFNASIHLSFFEFSNISESDKKKFNKIGVSVHSVDEATAAQKLGASYVIAGHIFETKCKEGVKPRGISFLKEICRSVSIPVYAIGGINEKNTVACIEAGAAGVCMMSGFMNM